MSQWKVSNGRIVLFPQAPPFSLQPSALDLFQQIWAADPESFQKSPNPLFPSMARGKQGEMSVVCSVQPSRIDFAFSPASSDDPLEQAHLNLIEDARQFRAELTRVIGIIGGGA